MDGPRHGNGAAALFVVLLAWAPCAGAQMAGTTGVGMAAVPMMGSGTNSFGLMAVPMVTSPGGQGTAASSRAADPMGLGAVYGPVIPMTPGQAGLFMLSTQQRMLGLGNGQLSGVRPGGASAGRPGAASDPRTARRGITETGGHPAETHTRNSNVPGGQASRFFNRGDVAASQGRPFYNRQVRQFPHSGQ